MKKFLLGFLIGLVVAALFGAILVFGALAAFSLGGERPARVADGSVLELSLSGAIPEQAPVELPIPILGQQAPLTIIETWQLLRHAATDDRIQALVLKPQGLGIGWAKMEELRGDILRFKESGKPVFAYLRGAGAREYYLASAADRIYMSPEDWLDVKGLRAELMYLKGSLDKLGVEMEFESVGLYKDAPDQFTKQEPSATTLEVINQELDQFYGDLVGVIAEGRGKTPEEVRGLIDQGPFVGENAQTSGLVDELGFENQMYDELKDRLVAESGFDAARELAKVGGRTYSRATESDAGDGARVAVVTGDGEILPSGTDLGLSDVAITASQMTSLLDRVREDDQIQGVILRVDSPGGDAVASDEILYAVKRLSEEKPVVISMSDYAASGGYMMSMTGDPVVAYANTQTGSIGVFFGKINLRGLYGKLGVNKHLLLRGRWSDIDSDYTPLSPAARAKLQGELQTYYRRFVEQVAEARGEPYETIEPLAQGRVWLGSQALDNGLVDEIGGLDRAVEMIRERAGIGGDEEISLVTYPQRRSLTDVLFNRGGAETQLAGLLEEVAGEMGGRLPVRALLHGGVMRAIPYAVEIQ